MNNWKHKQKLETGEDKDIRSVLLVFFFCLLIFPCWKWNFPIWYRVCIFSANKWRFQSLDVIFFFSMCLWFHSFLMEFSMNLHFLYWCVPYSVSLLYSCYFLLFLVRKTTRMISSTHINWSYSIQVIQNIYVFLLCFSVLHSHCQYWRMEKKLMSCKMTYKLIMEETSF